MKTFIYSLFVVTIVFAVSGCDDETATLQPAFNNIDDVTGGTGDEVVLDIANTAELIRS